jgi:hypothetical protein
MTVFVQVLSFFISVNASSLFDKVSILKGETTSLDRGISFLNDANTSSSNFECTKLIKTTEKFLVLTFLYFFF